ncbi:FAD-dependent oxidoreductase [Mucilaginibacter sp.]|uniref:FAD-dependent oxidoreductase n=1 Tax=Mucilaginibacter sp. TaxID=1882438 RepID=UPI00262CF4FD|nr:FAD-dependent oxidoreductase [Mucilaginibacter sp.]MDB5032491.1 hypothetical protein [Mucilaginibacter sp.]
MAKKLFLLILFFNYYFTYAETIKTDVLVIGSGPGAVAAAMQCAHSKIKTILLVKGGWLESMQSQKMEVITTGSNLPSGIWGQFRKDVQDFYKKTPGYDTTYNAPLKFEPYTGAAILKKTADTTKNLAIKLNTPYTAIKKDGTGWIVSITVNGKTDYIKAKVIIDATETGEVVTTAGAKLPAATAYNDNLYRTAIVSGDCLKKDDELSKAEYPLPPAYYIPVKALVAQDADNLFIADKALGVAPGLQNLPLQMATGQGVGTMAAFCAFFKTTQKNLKVRLIQGELLDFKGYILPFEDINPTDRYFRAIQQISATGLLKGTQQTNGNTLQFVFLPNAIVNTTEIKPVLTEIYSRAFIWFNKNKPGEQFTVGNLLSFIGEITLTEPQAFQTTIQKEWKTKYKFASDFDMNRPITRREFAILANQFLNPFARVVDLDGRMVN